MHGRTATGGEVQRLDADETNPESLVGQAQRQEVLDPLRFRVMLAIDHMQNALRADHRC